MVSGMGLVINYGKGGYEVENRGSEDRVKLFAPPFKGWKLFVPSPFHYSMAKTSCYHVNTTPETFCGPRFSMDKTFPAPPPPRCIVTSP